ncbi:MAG: cytochrome b562 [Planctomycetota bacterium]
MIQWKLAVVGIAALSSLAFVPNTAPSTQDPAPAAAAAARADEPSLEQRMKAMKRAFGKVKDFAAKGEGAAPLAEVDALLQNALAARNMVPEMAADIPEAERAKWLAAYKQGMRDTVRSLLELEQALEAGDKAKVKELAEALGKQQKEGHKHFKKDND